MVRKSFEVPEGEGYANYYRVLLHHYLYPTLNWKTLPRILQLTQTSDCILGIMEVQGHIQPVMDRGLNIRTQ